MQPRKKPDSHTLAIKALVRKSRDHIAVAHELSRRLEQFCADQRKQLEERNRCKEQRQATQIAAVYRRKLRAVQMGAPSESPL